MTEHDPAVSTDSRTIDEPHAPFRLTLDGGGHVAYHYLGA